MLPAKTVSTCSSLFLSCRATLRPGGEAGRGPQLQRKRYVLILARAGAYHGKCPAI